MGGGKLEDPGQYSGFATTARQERVAKADFDKQQQVTEEVLTHRELEIAISAWREGGRERESAETLCLRFESVTIYFGRVGRFAA